MRQNIKPYFAEKIDQVLKLRQQVNSRYSLRAFARALNIQPAILSDVIRGKRTLPDKTACDVAEKLKLNEKEKNSFLASNETAKSSVWRSVRSQIHDYYTLEENLHKRLIEEWEHSYIFTLFELDGFSDSIDWWEKTTGLPYSKVEVSLKLLEKLRFVDRDPDTGHYVKIVKKVRSTKDVESSVLQNYHRNILRLASEKISQLSVEKRFYGASTFSMSKERIGEAKELIRNFKREFVKLMQKGPKDSAYQINIQFFPLGNDLEDGEKNEK